MWRKVEWSFEDGEEESANRQWVWDAKVDVAAASSGAFTAASGAMSEATWQEVDWETAEDDEEECTESVPPRAACAGAFTAASGAFTADSTAAGAFTVEHYTDIHRIQHLASQHPLVAAVSSLTATASGAPSASAASGAPSASACSGAPSEAQGTSGIAGIFRPRVFPDGGDRANLSDFWRIGPGRAWEYAPPRPPRPPK